MKLSRILGISALALGAIGVLLFVFSFLFVYQPENSNYFFNGAILPAFAVSVSALACLFGIVWVILTKRDSLPQPTVPSRAPLPAALGAFASAVWLIVQGQFGIGILLLLASAFFVLEFCAVSKLYAGWILWPGFAAIAGVIWLIVTYYFDMHVEMNAPVKILFLFALLFVMLLVTVECRVLLGQFDRIFSPVILFAAFVFATAAGAVGVYLLIGKKSPGPAYPAAFPLLLGAGITALLRLFHLVIPSQKDPSSNAESQLQGEHEE